MMDVVQRKTEEKHPWCHNAGPFWHLTGVNSLNKTALLLSLINSHMVSGSVLHNSTNDEGEASKNY